MKKFKQYSVRICILVFGMVLFFAAPVFAQTNLRGWHDTGQTWLVWEDAYPTPFLYEIYVSDQPITDIQTARLAGKICYKDWTASRLKLINIEENWHIPDGQGHMVRLEDNEAVFVYTPHEAESAYFAVVSNDQTEVGPENTVGPIAQTLDPVQCHLQFSGTYADRDYSLYAYWIDGREDWDSGRPEFPVMGNQSANGIGYVFAVLEPETGRTSGAMPAAVHVHGVGDECSYLQVFATASLDEHLTDGFQISMDDVLLVRRDIGPLPLIFPTSTYWFGYWPGYDRFESPHQVPGEGDIIINYTFRRMDFVLDWIVENEQIDPNRISMYGLSGGGSAVSSYTRWRPGFLSAALIFVPTVNGPGWPSAPEMLGEIADDLPTNLPGDIGVISWYWPTLFLEGQDLPFMRFIIGRADVYVDWSESAQAYRELDTKAYGAQLYWDEREHINQYGGWLDAHWYAIPKLHAQSLTRYRNDETFPAFSNDDQNLTMPGRQPILGNGDPENGDPWGTWGGYFDWDQGTLTDTPTLWGATVFLESQSDFPNEIPEFDHCTTNISVRRAQQFQHEAGTTLYWVFTDTTSQELIRHGQVTADENALVTVEDLTIYKSPRRLEISTTPLIIDDDDDNDNDDNDNDDSNNDDDNDDNDDSTTPDPEDESGGESDNDDNGCGC